MNIVRVMGGLGNQLFQYAFGRALAIKHNTPTYYDVRNYFIDTNNTYRSLSLNHFPYIKANYINSFLLNSLVKLRLIKKITDQNYNYINSNLSYAYYSGYWQKLNLFQNVETTIRNELNIPDIINSKYYKMITENNSVGLHVRLKDYLSPTNIQIYKQLKLEYYQESINIINTKNPDVKIFIFSDDIEHAKIIFKYINKEIIFVENNGEIFQDFALLSACKNNIIANSTFSWWAAWLNKNISKIVIAPKQWYTTEIVTNIYPKEWIII